MTYTHHALARARQRGIPPLIEQWLDAYGQEDYDGNGGRRVFFSKASIRRMERDFGRAPVQKLSEWLDVYKVVLAMKTILEAPPLAATGRDFEIKPLAIEATARPIAGLGVLDVLKREGHVG